MSEAIIAKKAELVDAVAEQMKAATSIVVVDARGLTVEQDTVLRRNLRGEEVEYKVIKNSILRRAAVQAGLDGLTELFVGPSAVAFSTDAVAPAKVIYDFAKTADALEIKGGAVEGKVSTKAEIEALATLPNREGMLSMLLSVLQAPVRNVAYAVKAVAENKEEVMLWPKPCAGAFRPTARRDICASRWGSDSIAVIIVLPVRGCRCCRDEPPSAIRFPIRCATAAGGVPETGSGCGGSGCVPYRCRHSVNRQ